MTIAKRKTDLRVVKTHHALNEAFLRLLEERSLDDITVNDLCTEADIRRATFYKHFSGKTAFVAAHSMATAFLVRIPIAYFMSRIDGATLFHVGLGTPAASVVSLILCVYFFRKHYAGDKIKNIQMIG